MTGVPTIANSKTELPHGYTVASVTALVRTAARTPRGLVISFDEACDAASLAVIERLYADEPEPSRLDLYRAANRALGSANAKELAYRGYYKDVPGQENLRPRFAAYWHGLPLLYGPFEEVAVETIALAQVWDALPERHREALLTLVELGSHKAAIEVLGLPKNTWMNRITTARKAARALWYSPDKPAPQWGCDFPGSKQTVRELLAELRKRHKNARRALEARQGVPA